MKSINTAGELRLRLVITCIFLIAIIADMSMACTVFVIDGSLTDDGRPISGKIRHPVTLETRQSLRLTSRYTYDYISSEWGIGINETGLFVGDAALSVLNPPLTEVDNLNYIEMDVAVATLSMPYDPNDPIDNGKLRINSLAEISTVDEARDFIEFLFDNETSQVKSNFAYMDALGNSSIFEINRSEWWYEYNALDPNRLAQDTYGFVVRENAAHKMADGTDDLRIQNTRCESGRYNIQGMIDENNLSINTIARGTAAPGEGYEFLRYGPDREMTVIADDKMGSLVLIHGVLPEEDPLLTTMWLGLGNSNYGILVPTWVKVTSIPSPLWAESSEHMFDRAMSLLSKGNEEITQQSTFPFESHIFDEVSKVLLPHWREYGTPSESLMSQVQHQIAEDAYSLLHCLDLVRYDNKAPGVDFGILPDDMTLKFILDANDPDGNIASVFWNFGDNITSSDFSPTHTYATPGDYLISCTVVDDEGVSNTKWAYFQVPFSRDLSGDGRIGIADLRLTTENWLSTCAEPFWCQGSDLNQSGRVDFQDFAILSEYWMSE